MILSVTGMLAACSPAEFRMYSDLTDTNGSQGAVEDPTPTICDPFSPDNIISATSGLKGSIHYLEPGSPQYTRSTDVISKGKMIDADLFLRRIFVPTRIFSTGFATDDGKVISDSNGQVLNEWFALNLNSRLQLGRGDTDGDYQLALLSDDGSTLSLQNDLGVFEPIVQNEGLHPTQLACSSKVIRMTSETRLPMNLTYFQGPRQHISMTLLWRKIPAGATPNALADVECGKSGNDYFFNVGTQTTEATPRKPYQDLLARGWKPLSDSNFELQSGSNRCAI